jgi:succinyl-CoA synthetase alpha subunit
MSVLLGRDTKVIVQGMGREGTFHATRMREYGTKVVGGVVARAGGTTRGGLPILDTL